MNIQTKNLIKMNTTTFFKFRIMVVILLITTFGCKQPQKEIENTTEEKIEVKTESPEYFQLRPDVEKAYGYSHAVKIGNNIKLLLKSKKIE